MQYTDEELNRLHECLYDILGEITRVCRKINIDYVMLGGSAIGCHFWEGIIPFDDDIDIAMTRNDYERFLREAPRHLRPGYFLQWIGSDPHTPFYFAKVRRDGTLFIEETTRNIDMHQGIYVDIFPLDRIPDNPRHEQRQRKLLNIVNACFVSKEVWMWRYCGKCEISVPKKHGFLNSLFDRIVVTVVPKRMLYKIMCKIMTWYNSYDTTYYNHVITALDHIRATDLENKRVMKFGPITVCVPDHLEDYLKHHYPTLRKYLPADEQAAYSHRPVKLSFGN